MKTLALLFVLIFLPNDMQSCQELRDPNAQTDPLTRSPVSPLPSLGAVSVLDAGADPTGQTDSQPAITRSISRLCSTGGTVYLPPGRYKLEKTLLVKCSGITLRGAGLAATKLVGVILLNSVVQEGDPSNPVVNNAIEELTVGRAPGLIPTGSVSICWANFNYGFEFNTAAENSFYARAWDSSNKSYLSIGYRGIHMLAANATRAYAHITDAADVLFEASEFGKNGGELYDPAYVIEVSGSANDISVSDTVIIPRGPTANSATLLGFTHYHNATGIIRFADVTTENIAHFVSSDRHTPTITEMSIANSRIAFGESFGTLDTDTTLRYANFTGTNFGGGDMNITNPTRTQITGGFIQSLSVVGADETNSITVTGAEVGNVHFAGNFGSLIFAGNSQVAGASFIDESNARTKFVQNRGEIRTGSHSKPGLSLSYGFENGSLGWAIDASGAIRLFTNAGPGAVRNIAETLSHPDNEPLHFLIPVTLSSYDIRSLPLAAGPMQWAVIRVIGLTAQSVSPYAYSDGKNWRFVSDGTIVR